MPPRTRGQRRSRKQRSGSESSPLDVFFANYPEFEYDSAGSASLEFYRLCDQLDWGRDDPERVEAHLGFKNALVQQFNRLYGTDKDSLSNWQNLCHMVHMDPIPDDLDACREAVRATHVNLVDLVDTGRTGDEVQVFSSELQLSQYTKSTGKYFPRENAYAGGLLRYLLRHIFHPATDSGVSSRPRTNRRR